MLLFHIICTLLIFTIVTPQKSKCMDGGGEEFVKTVVKAGEDQFKLATHYSQMPVYGDCWKKPLESLPIACGNLTEDNHKLLALTFANCFMLQSHQKPHPCVEPTLDNITSCLKMGMEDRVFTSYNQFYVHTHNMCYYLKSQIWHEETKKTVNLLMQSSQRVINNMESQLEIQNKIRTTQEEALKNGVELRREMDVTILRSKESIQAMLDEIRTSSGKQMAIFDEISHHIVKLRALFFGELVGVYTALYYFFIVVVSYLLTSCKRLEGARMWLYVLYACSLVVEHFVSNWGIEESTKIFSDQIQAMVYERIWILRKLTIGMCVVVLIVCGWKYRDCIDVMCELQKENLETRKEILSLIETMREVPSIRSSLITSHTQILSEESRTDHIQSKKQSPPIKSDRPERLNKVKDVTPMRDVQPENVTRVYNLRARSRSRSPQISMEHSTESPSDFAKTVNYSAKTSKQHSILVRQQMSTLKRNYKQAKSLSVLSSDED